MKKILMVCLVFYIAGCSSTRINYSPNIMDIETAIDTADQLIMTQNEKWRPEGFGVNDKYISLTFVRPTTKVLNKLYTKGGGERIYYSRVSSVELMEWWRRGKAWYVVTVYSAQGRENKHLFYSRNIEESILFFNSLYTIIYHPYETEKVSPHLENINK